MIELKETLPIDYVISKDEAEPILDKIVLVSCSLVNLCDSIIYLQIKYDAH